MKNIFFSLYLGFIAVHFLICKLASSVIMPILLYLFFLEMSESLISLFIKPVVVEHSGGHYVACSGSIKDAYQDFLHDRCQDLNEEDQESKEDGDRRNS